MRRAQAVLGLALVAAPLAGQAVVGIAPAATLLSQGGRATVPLVANMTNAGGALLGAYQLQVTFDPAVVRYVGVAPGAFGTPTVNAANAGTGTLSLAGANPAGAGGVVTLANLTFEMLVASGSSPAAIGGPTLTAAGTFAGIAVNTVSASFCTAIGTFGDVDNDGSVLGNDALIVVTAAVGLPIAPYSLTNADVDQNGSVDTRDALFILSSAVGLPTPGTRVGQLNAGACGGPAPQTLAITPSPVQLAPGDVIALLPNALDSTGIPTAAHGIVWFSSNPGIASVNDTLGVVTAVANGTDSIIATTVAGPADTAIVTVADRHTWFVDGAVALDPSQQLGSSAFPFATIAQALARAAANDTVRIAVAPNPYGPATISKPVVVLGDSGASGMPTVSNSAGAALTVSASGRVHLQWLNLDQSNTGVDATGDTLDVQSLSASALRGPAIRVHTMARADVRDVHVTSATLAGLWFENTPSVAVTGAALSVIAARNDSAVGVVVRNGGAADLSDVTVFGVDQDGPGIVADSVTRTTITNYASNTGSALDVERARFASVSGAVMANGGCGSVSTNCNAGVRFAADTAVVDTVQLVNPAAGIMLRPHRGSALASQAKITRSTLSAVQVGTAASIDSVGDVSITGLLVDTAFNGGGVLVTNGTNAVVQQTTVRAVGGVGVSIDPAGVVSVQHVTVHGAAAGGVRVDGAFVTNLLDVSVDSSAQPDFTVFNAPARFAVRVAHADTVHADSLNLHDNPGGGLLVDSAQVLTGFGGIVARNAGQGGFGGDCGPNGCTCGTGCIIGGQAPPAHLGPARTAYAATTVPGVVVSNVSRGTLSHFTVDSNARGGIQLTPYDVTAWVFDLDSSFVRGANLLLAADGYLDATGQVTVTGSHFAAGSEGIEGLVLNQLVIQGSTFDSVPNTPGSPAIALNQVATAVLTGDTIRGGLGSGIEAQNVVHLDLLNGLIRGRQVGYSFNPEAGLGFGVSDTVTVRGMRFDSSAVHAVRIDNFQSGPIAIDSNAITDHGGVALQISTAAQVTRNFIARNFVGIDVFSGGEASGIHQNNFVGNTLAALRGQGLSNVAADSNWWNDPLGPTCLSGCAGTVGDSVSGLVIFLPPLTAPAIGVPLLAKPIRTSTQTRQQVKREGQP